MGKWTNKEQVVYKLIMTGLIHLKNLGVIRSIEFLKLETDLNKYLLRYDKEE